MKPRRTELLCKCNEISREQVERAIADGCRTLDEIFDATTAGAGPCGGECRRDLARLLEAMRPENPDDQST